jgi:hypothetical protein
MVGSAEVEPVTVVFDGPASSQRVGNRISVAQNRNPCNGAEQEEHSRSNKSQDYFTEKVWFHQVVASHFPSFFLVALNDLSAKTSPQ